MKKQLLTCALAALSFASFATIRTADNNASNPGNYTSLQKAIDDSNAGDTIYLKASPISYGDIVLNKPLAIIGDGVLNKKTSMKSTFMGKVEVQTAAGGSALVGFEATEIWVDNINKLLLDRLKFGDLYGQAKEGNIQPSTWSSVLIRNCYFKTHFSLAKMSDVYIDNSVLINFDSREKSNNLIVSNSILLGLWPCEYVTFRNSIIEHFMFSDGYKLDLYISNLFENNLFVVVEGDHLAKLNAKNFLTGNNIFENAAISATFKNYNAGLKNLDAISTDLRLVDGSKGKNAGTDGKDMGIYGGAFPWEDSYFSNPGLVRQVPHVMDIQTVSQSPNKASIDVNIKAKSIK